jgi:hypothetical protein
METRKKAQLAAVRRRRVQYLTMARRCYAEVGAETRAPGHRRAAGEDQQGQRRRGHVAGGSALLGPARRQHQQDELKWGFLFYNRCPSHARVTSAPLLVVHEQVENRGQRLVRGRRQLRRRQLLNRRQRRHVDIQRGGPRRAQEIAGWRHDGVQRGRGHRCRCRRRQQIGGGGGSGGGGGGGRRARRSTRQRIDVRGAVLALLACVLETARIAQEHVATGLEEKNKTLKKKETRKRKKKGLRVTAATPLRRVRACAPGASRAALHSGLVCTRATRPIRSADRLASNGFADRLTAAPAVAAACAAFATRIECAFGTLVRQNCMPCSIREQRSNRGTVKKKKAFFFFGFCFGFVSRETSSSALRTVCTVCAQLALGRQRQQQQLNAHFC